MRENGVNKIKKWLKNRGHYMTFVETQMYRHSDNFHKGELYQIDVYRTSLGYYIKCKTQGKPRYYLCEKSNSLVPIYIIDFSQMHFIKQLEKYFPKMDEF